MKESTDCVTQGITPEASNLKLDQPNVQQSENSFKQSRGKEIRQSGQWTIQGMENLSNDKQNQENDILLEGSIQQKVCREYRKVICFFIIMCIIIGGALWIYSSFVNSNSNSNYNIIDTNKTNNINNSNQTNETNDTINTINDPIEFLDLVILNSTTALCLDGSPASYYISRKGDQSKVLLYFMGGAWCGDRNYEQTIESCYQRSKTVLGSSNFDNSSIEKYQGIFSRDNQNYFKDWKKVILNYCDGIGHQGTREQPIQYNGTLLYFRGHNNTVEKLQNLEEKIGLFSNATQIIVTGESAGGLASLMWVNYVADRAQKAKVLGMPVSGVFYDAFNYPTNAYYQRQIVKSIVNISNQQIDPPIPECVKAYPNSKQNCHFAQYMYKYIKVPIFMVQSLYDTWCTAVVMGVHCSKWFQKKTNCDTTQTQRIEQYRATVFKMLQQVGSVNNNGVWGVACPAHLFISDFKLYSQIYRIPEGSSYSVNEAIKRWIENTTSTHVYLDSAHWPQNYACSGERL